MDLGLTDKVALVSGSSRGIGRAIARAFLQNGSRVVVTGRDEGRLVETTEVFGREFGPERVMSCQGDLSEPAQVQRILAEVSQRWRSIDCLIANIGSGSGIPGWEIGRAEWERAFVLNFWSAVSLVEAYLPQMVQRRQGCIVFVASIVGLESLKAPLPYSAAKASLINYSKNLSRQVGNFDIRVNCVAPGNILFPGGTWERKLAEKREEVEQYIRDEVPLQRFGTVQEIADVVVYLASNRAAFITGSCLVVDGGQTRGI